MSRSLLDLESATHKMAIAFLEGARGLGHDLIVTYTLRSLEEQGALYAKGRVFDGPIVTNAKPGYSWHNFGRAFDVAFKVGGRVTWNGPWEEIGRLGELMGFEWGGRWHSIVDKPHFQNVMKNGNKYTLAMARKDAGLTNG